MTWFGNFYRSAVGKKAVMAVTGLILFGWVFLHMLGNLKLYLGPEHLNEYAAFLRSMFGPAVPESGMLWLSRVILFVAVVFHIHAARTMRWGGVIILLFIIYHLLHLTTGQAHHDFIKDDVYHNVVTGFQATKWGIPWVAAVYIIANLALGLHLYHGVWAMFSSLGVTHARFENWRRAFATAFALIITLGNVSFPLAVLAGFVR